MKVQQQELRASAHQSFAEGNFENALEILRIYLELYGADIKILNDLAITSLKIGHAEAAVNYFRAAQELRLQDDRLLFENLVNSFEFLQKKTNYVNLQSNDKFERWLADKASSLHEDAKQVGDEEWATAIYDSFVGENFKNHILPAFIDTNLQRMYVGSSGIDSLREAYNFIMILLKVLERLNIEFTDDSVVVDFGSGWGRYTRFMLKYVHPDNLYGLELSSSMVEHCRKAFGMANFLKVKSMPPCQLRSGMVDLIFGYSVFSHLAPSCADAWISEFARITKKGGLVIMTTQGRSFIEFCSNVRKSGDRSHPWFISLAKAFADSDQAYRDYDTGKFLHFSEGQHEGTYGESLIPKGYIEQNWKIYFDLIDFFDDRSLLPQALFVLRRNGNPYR